MQRKILLSRTPVVKRQHEFQVGDLIISPLKGRAIVRSIPQYCVVSGGAGWFAAVQYKGRDIVQETCIDGFMQISKQIFNMKEPHECPLCRLYFDLGLMAAAAQKICPECTKNWTGRKCPDEKHEMVEVNASDIHEQAWNCYHYYVCKKCGAHEEHDSSD